jgi:hypothetical protein
LVEHSMWLSLWISKYELSASKIRYGFTWAFIMNGVSEECGKCWPERDQVVGPVKRGYKAYPIWFRTSFISCPREFSYNSFEMSRFNRTELFRLSRAKRSWDAPDGEDAQSWSRDKQRINTLPDGEDAQSWSRDKQRMRS